MIAFRKSHEALRRGQFFNGSVNERGSKDVSWHGTKLEQPGWSDPNSRVLAFTLAGFNGEPDIHVLLNMASEALDFELPRCTGAALAPGGRYGTGIPERLRRPGRRTRGAVGYLSGAGTQRRRARQPPCLTEARVSDWPPSQT